MKILFTSVGRRVELMQLFREAANFLGIQLVIYGADMDSTAPALQFCDKFVEVPRIKSEDYIPTLLGICKAEQIDALVPTIDTDLLILAQNKDKFAEINTKVFVSDSEKVAICRDKRKTEKYFQSVGLNSPMTVDAADKYEQSFPAFIKPMDGSSSINAYKVSNREELDVYASQIADYIVQPFISGTEYTVDVFCDYEGNPIYITPRIRLAVRAGEVLKTRVDQDAIIIEEMKQLIADYKPCGAITVQLIKDDTTGQNWYIEINPRFGGGAPLSMKAGADSAKAMLQLLAGTRLDYMPMAAEDGAVFSRFDQSVRIK